MKRLLILLFLLLAPVVALSQGAPPITFTEVDGSPRKTAPTKIVVSNGTLTCVGSVCTITTGGGGGSGLADPGANGVVVRTSAGVTTARTLAGTANRIVITNGTGVSGNPTFDIGSDVVTLTGIQSLTNKTLSVPTVADFTNATHVHTNAAGGGQLNASNIFSAGTVPVARLPLMVGDSGSGGTAGLVPAPVTGDATKFLRGDATWQTVSGGGGSPGGSDTQLQYNAASAFGGVGGATSDGTNVIFGSANLRATSPRLTTGILDANGAGMFTFTATASAVNGFSFTNSATGNSPVLAPVGSDTDVDVTFSPKGGGSNIFTKNLVFNVGTGGLDNLIYVGGTSPTAVNASFGFLVGGRGSDDATEGPYFLARGNNWTGLTDQRGAIFMVAGTVTSPNAAEGSIRFFTGAEVERLQITRDGTIQLSPITLTNLGTPANGNYAYCSDCSQGDPCTSGGTGRLAIRANSRWYCP